MPSTGHQATYESPLLRTCRPCIGGPAPLRHT
jgi:hypothetical protein